VSEEAQENQELIQPFPLHRPRFELAPLVTTAEHFESAINELNQGSGPLAVDAERASGYRYFANAYLFQFYRRGSRIFLLDPITLVDEKRLITRFNELLGDQEWIIHASTQDLPCIREFGFSPRHLFDTELGARLAGLPRVGLGPLTEQLLSLSLAKEHSAVDWSIRPLHPEWKNYAALDVDVLPDLRDAVVAILESQGKMELAMEEFQSILKAKESEPRRDPWRRTSGIHHVKGRRGLAIVRELWNERDRIARERDLAAGRLFPDFAISDLAIASRDLSQEEFIARAQEIFHGSQHFQRHYRKFKKEFFGQWSGAIARALSLPEEQLPPMRATSDALPPVKIWKERAPLAYARLTHARFNLQEVSAELLIPLENLISPEIVRRIAWMSERQSFTTDSLQESLLQLGARPWQIERSLDAILRSLSESEPRVVPENASKVVSEEEDSTSLA
jgi:ribonuclease D